MNHVLGLTPSEMKEFCETGMITPERMRAVDRNAAALGVRSLQLMECAGKALAEAALELQPERVLILCGKGNNGGDGLAAARHLQRCSRVDVIHPAEGMATADARAQLLALRHSAVSLHAVRCAEDIRHHARLFSDPDLIIDAMLGTGVSGAPREPILSCISHANASMAPVIAADVPTPGINADFICAFHRSKVEGSRVVEIGIPLAAEICVGPGDLRALSRKSDDAHKGAGGEVLVIGGGPYQGAPYLAALAALRAGADLVRVASPVFLPHPDLIVDRLEGSHITADHLDHLRDLARRADVVLIGNGLGTASHAVVEGLVPVCRRAVLDADALRNPLPRARETIYTPHAGEFKRIFENPLPENLAERARLVRQHAAGATVLVKGRTDIISDGERVRFNTTGCPAMTAGGTGDILAGVVAALFCRNTSFEAACAAAYINGRAGMRVAERRGNGLMASDLLDTIPDELYQGDE